MPQALLGQGLVLALEVVQLILDCAINLEQHQAQLLQIILGIKLE